MKELTAICCVCKKHYRGPAPVPGVAPSHGYCPECFPLEMAKARNYIEVMKKVRA